MLKAYDNTNSLYVSLSKKQYIEYKKQDGEVELHFLRTNQSKLPSGVVVKGGIQRVGAWVGGGPEIERNSFSYSIPNTLEFQKESKLFFCHYLTDKRS